MSVTPARDPRSEATVIAGREARVLEPSPPAVQEAPWFADDPTAPDGADDAVMPTTAGAVSWNQLAADDADIARYARDHWLGAWKGLAPVPSGYVAARDDFHRLAYGVVSNARKAANGKFGLRYTHGGFGTPFFGDDEQVRVEGTELVRQRGADVERTPITTLAAAASFLDTVANSDQAEHDTVELGELDRALAIEEEVGAFLGDWFGFAASVLEETRLIGVAPDDDVSRVQIWPGHFDAAIEIGSADGGRRATYGMSPGDAAHDEPYVYVAPWSEGDRSDAYWNDPSFNGASLAYRDLLVVPDARDAALAFLARGYELLSR